MKFISKIDGHITHLSEFIVDKPKANVLILHGMAEHRFRYDGFAKFLNDHDINVYTLDIRGHGESKVDGYFGFFAKEDGFKKNVDDINDIIQIIKNKNGLPLILFGHSMGSLFARSYVKRHPNNIDGLILTGSPGLPVGFKVIKAGLKIPAFFFTRKKARFVSKMMNNTFNKTIKNKRTDLDWLSFNQDNVDAYIADPLSNFTFTYSGYLDIFNLMEDVYLKNWGEVDPYLPIYFMIGQHDTTLDFNRDDFFKAIHKMKQVGHQIIFSKIYENSRHEILNDNEKDTVMNDILDFILIA